MLPVVIAPAQVGRHVGQNRVFSQVVVDHVGNVGVDDLVVGHAVARSIRQRHVARAIRFHQSGHAEQRVLAERLRVQEVVVDAAVDDIDPAKTHGGPHVDDAVLHHQVAAFHQRNAHLLRQEAVFEIRGVVHARRQQHHGGFATQCPRVRWLRESPADGWDSRRPDECASLRRPAGNVRFISSRFSST